jgi:hypothetical protein
MVQSSVNRPQCRKKRLRLLGRNQVQILHARLPSLLLSIEDEARGLIEQFGLSLIHGDDQPAATSVPRLTRLFVLQLPDKCWVVAISFHRKIEPVFRIPGVRFGRENTRTGSGCSTLITPVNE